MPLSQAEAAGQIRLTLLYTTSVLIMNGLVALLIFFQQNKQHSRQQCQLTFKGE
jgi:hypothetical protein